MLMAVFSGVSGDLPALRAVLDAVDEEGIHTVLNAGDSVVGGTQPNEVIALLRARRIPSVQGAWDRRAVRFVRKRAALEGRLSAPEFQTLQQTYEALHSENLEFLRGLSPQCTLTIEGLRVFLGCGVPGRPSEIVREEDSAMKLQRAREFANAEIIICGGGTRPFARMVDGALFVCPGAAGGRGGSAAYAVVDTESEPWRAEFRQVPY